MSYLQWPHLGLSLERPSNDPEPLEKKGFCGILSDS